MNRRQKIDMLLEHEQSQKWFQDLEAKVNADQAERDRISRELRDRQDEWNYGPIKERRGRRDAILAELRGE